MADIFQEEYNSAVEYTEVDDIVFESKENASNVSEEQESEEESKSEDNNHGFGNLDVESSDLVESHPVAQSLEELANSDFIHNRQLAARKILDFLSEARSNKDELHTVISVMCKLSDDDEPVVRSELMEQIPPIASFCREHGPDLESIIRQQLVPITVKLVTDNQIQVRKVGQAFLLVLLERNLIDSSQLTEWICPLISQLATSVNNTEELRSEAITIMCKMAPLVGKDITVKFFLEPFSTLCSDEAFMIRKVCLHSFGELCKVVGTEPTETTLFPRFLALCTDEMCSVRKACVEVFVDVSSIVTPASRIVLANYYIDFIQDESRWIKFVALQFLGSFLTTFADPTKTGLSYDNGTWTSVTTVATSQHKNSHIHSINENETGNDQITNADLNNSFVELKESDNENEMDTKESPVEITERRDNTEVSQSNVEVGPSGAEHNLNNMDTSESTNIEENCNQICGSGDDTLTGSSSVEQVKSESIENKNINQSVPHNENRTSNVESSIVSDLLPYRVIHCRSTEDADAISQADSTSSDVKESNIYESGHSNDSESSVTVAEKDGHIRLHLDNENVFNNFQFWRSPLPELEVDIDIERGKATNIHVWAKVHDEKSNRICASDLKVNIASCEEPDTSLTGAVANDSGIVSGYTNQPGILKMQVQTACTNTVVPFTLTEQSSVLDRCSGFGSFPYDDTLQTNQACRQSNFPSVTLRQQRGRLKDSQPTVSIYDQDIVPPLLLEKYLEMIESLQKTICKTNTELTKYCAFSLPGVAYTLGRNYWCFLKDLCVTLASDMQWKIRKTVASYLHELAVIIGPELTARDLLPLFLALLKDLDEVRLVLLLHLSDFLKHLQPLERKQFLPLVDEFLKMDNEKNWRFRYTLAQQMIPTTDLYSPADVRKYLFPVASWLIRDRISEVRLEAIRLMAIIVKHLAEHEELSYAKQLLAELNEKFRQAHKWLWRQAYALLCQQLALNNSLPNDVFVEKVVPNLFSLAWDIVPNVRLAVSRCLAQTLLPMGYLPIIQQTHYQQLLLQVMYSLQSDVDKDVRYFAHLSDGAFNILPQKLSPV